MSEPDLTPIDAPEFFRRMHAAFLGDMNAERDSGGAIDRLTTRAFDLFEKNVAAEAGDFPELACQKNCPACCTLRVTATAPEIFLVAHYVRLIAATSSGAQINLPGRIAEAARATSGLDEADRMTLRCQCPFVFKGACIIHPVRPLACRGHASFDRQACALAAAGRDVEVPISELHLNMRGMVQAALQSALRASDLAWGLYELNQGLDLALDGEERCAAWLRGEDSLAPARIDLDMRAMAATFDTLLEPAPHA